MRRALAAELRKIRTLWSTWVLLGAAGVVSGLLGLLVGFGPHRRPGVSVNVLFPAQGSVGWFDNVFGVMTIAVDFAMVLGVISITGEYRHKTITPTLLAEPRRGVVTASKLVVCALFGVLVGIVAGAVDLLFGFAATAGGIGTTSRMLTEFGHIWPGVAAAAVLFAIYGVGLGALLKNQVVALLVGLGATAFVEPIVEAATPSIGRWLPDAAAQALETVATRHAGFGFSTITDLVTWWEGALALVAYGAVLAVAGSLTTMRADVT